MMEGSRREDFAPSHLLQEKEKWHCRCDNAALVVKYEERIAACEVLLHEFHRHIVAQQTESQSLRAELAAQRQWWERLAQLFAGR